MNKAIIDIGSNSVRIMVCSGGKILLRSLITTQLAKDREKNGKLSYKSINSTLNGIIDLKNAALQLGECAFEAFATAAVRNAPDGEDFCKLVKEKAGVNVRVLSGDEESLLGITGALKGGDGCVIDVGGGSAEIAAAQNGKIIYSHSAQFGAVTLSEACPRDMRAVFDYINQRTGEYGKLPPVKKVYGIGGTANTLAFIGCGLEKYDREKQNGYFLSCEELYERIEEFFACSPEELAEKRRIDLKRARVIPFGAAALYCCIKALGANGATLSEDDNLDGYYLLSQGTKAYEK